MLGLELAITSPKMTLVNYHMDVVFLLSFWFCPDKADYIRLLLGLDGVILSCVS